MRMLAIILSTFLLTACVGNPPRQASIAQYDLGDISGPGVVVALPLTGIEVRAAAWLDSTAQFYRLAYAEPLQRHAYTESRWVVPPAALVQRLLNQRIVMGQAAALPACRLRVTLDEFEQRFDTPQTSRTVLDVRVQLLSSRSETPLDQQMFRLDRPAPSADARGGVQAARFAGEALVGDLAEWLEGVARERPALLASCR